MRPRIFTLFWTLVMALGLVVGACGSNGGSGSSTSTTCASATTSDGAGAIGGSNTTLVGNGPANGQPNGGAAGAVSDGSGVNTAGGGAPQPSYLPTVPSC